MDQLQRRQIEELLHDIQKQLPDVYREMLGCLDEYDGFAPSKMFGQFCEITNRAMREKDAVTLCEHLSYMSNQLKTAAEACYEMIDVYYVESLMWNVNADEAKWAWGYFPKNIKDLYIKMWGQPEF